MSTCKWEESEQDLEHRIIKAANFYAHTLLASFVTSFPSHQTTELKSKLWILSSFGQQQPGPARGGFRGYIVPGPGPRGPGSVQVSALSFGIAP